MSLTVYPGASQIMACGMVSQGVGTISILLAGLRHETAKRLLTHPA